MFVLGEVFSLCPYACMNMVMCMCVLLMFLNSPIHPVLKSIESEGLNQMGHRMHHYEQKLVEVMEFQLSYFKS